MAEEPEFIGVILSGGNSQEAKFQLFKEAEKGNIQEGMMVIVKTEKEKKLLGRVSSIIPYNAFFQEGDAWSEARRHKQKIPEEISRQFEICSVELLMKLPRKEITYPPRPGERVYAIDMDQHSEDIFLVKRDDEGIIWLGSLAGYQSSPIPLDIEKMPMHFAVFGVTGSGKSFNTGVLLENLLRINCGENRRVSYPLMIIDAHGDYIEYTQLNNSQLETFGFCPQNISRFVFPIAFRSIGGELNIERLGINLDLIPFRELAEIIVTYYKGTTQDSDLQINGIVRLFEEAIDAGLISEGDAQGYGFELNLLFTNNDIFNQLINTTLAGLDGIHPSTKSSIQRQLEEFKRLEGNYNLLSTDSILMDSGFVDNFTRSQSMAVVDFSADGAPGVDLKTKQMVLTYISTILFNQFTEFKINNQERYMSLIIEEAQNFCPSSSYPIGYSLSHSILSAIATQGRKFGLNLGIITQRPSFVDKIVLSMCNTFIIQRISPEDFNFVQSVTGGLPPSLARKLTNLETGKAIITGQMLTVPFPLLIRIPYEERNVEVSRGETSVVRVLGENING